MISAFIVLIIFLSWSWLRRLFFQHFLRLPTGPRGLPLVGNLHQLGHQPHETFVEWVRQYGEVFSVQIGFRTIVVLNTFEAAHEALVKQGRIFNHRTPTSLLRIEARGLGILNNEGQIWSEHRKFTLTCLKNKGFGKGSIESQLLEEITELINELESHQNQPVNPRNHLTLSVANILWSIVAGHRFNRRDPKLMELADMNDAVVRTIGNVGVMTFFPQLRLIFRHKYKTFHDAMENLRKFLYDELRCHRDANKQMTNPFPDLVDEFLTERKREEEHGEKITFTDEQICAILLDLFVAGVETTVTSLRWALLLLAIHTDVQQVIQNEIDEVIGRERLPSNDDRKLMPYTEAALAEIQRYACVIPVFFHCVSEDTTFMRYNIPKHTPILINNWGIHRDPTVWNNPDEFDITRFLSNDKHFIKIDSFMPFGIGKRSCPGESLARMELYLFIICLLQKFHISLPEGGTLPTKVYSGLVRSPESFQITFKAR